MILFMNLLRAEPIPNDEGNYRLKPSILITPSLLTQSINILSKKECKWMRLFIFNPINSEKELNDLIRKQSPV